MRRLAILATVFSLGSLACEPPKPSEPKPAKPETKPETKPAEPETKPAAAFDPAAACDRQATLLEERMKGIPDSATPPPGWREPYIKDCTADMIATFEVDAPGTQAYAECLIQAVAPLVVDECMLARARSRRRAELARQTRAPVPTGADACEVEAPLVRAAPQPPDAVHVQVSTKALCVDKAPVVAMVDGAVDPSAIENHNILAFGVPVGDAILSRRQNPLTPEIYKPGGAFEPVKLSFDQATPFASVIDVVYTLGREGASDYWYEVRTEAGSAGFIPFWPPSFDPSGRVNESAGMVMILESGLLVRSAGEETTLALADATRPTTAPERWDFAALDAQLSKLAAASSGEWFTVTAENTIPFAIVARVADAIRGPECPLATDPETWTTESCRFPKLIIEAGAS